jgi:hypothetical protein
VIAVDVSFPRQRWLGRSDAGTDWRTGEECYFTLDFWIRKVFVLP